MRIRKIIWWLILVYSYDKISAFDQFLYEHRSKSHAKMGKFFKLCYSDRLNPVMITSNLIEIIDEFRMEDSNFPLITIDRDFKASDVQILIPAHPLYILVTDFTDQLQRILTEIKKTPSWTIASSFYFIEAADNFCQNASRILQVFWKFDLLSSFYFCVDSNNDIWLYTYNPYTSRASELWIEVEADDKPDDRWTLYKQPYTSNDKRICQSLSYDKVMALDGYEVKAIGDSISQANISRNETYDTSTFDETLTNLEKNFLVSLFSTLNVTAAINYGDKKSYDTKIPKGFIQSIINGSHDMSIASRWIGGIDLNEVLDLLNLFYQNGFLILTQYKTFEIPTEEVTDFYDVHFAVALFLLVLIAAFMIIVYNTDNDYGLAGLDIFQIIIGRGILAPLERLSMQLCFVSSFLMIFFMNPAIGGQISSFLSSAETRDIESLEDVFNQKYNFYYYPNLEDRILDLNLWQNSSNRKYLYPDKSTYLSCAEFAFKDLSTACLSYSEFQVRDALSHNLHVTKTLDLKSYVSFWVRKNWPLKNRADQIAMRMTEAGLLDHWDKPSLHWPLKKIRNQESINASTGFEQVGFENMLSVFMLFFLISAIAFIIFGFEMLLKKIRPRRELRLQQKVVVFNRRVHVINEWV